MATFRKRSNGWQARIQRKGYPDIAKTFKLHSEAVNWAKEVEYKIYKGLFHVHLKNKEATLAELLERYRKEITPNKKSNKPELYRIKGWLNSDLADIYISNLRSSDFASYRDARLKLGKAGNTVKQELALISHLYFVARAEWGFENLDNPISHIRKPKLAKGRTRRVPDIGVWFQDNAWMSLLRYEVAPACVQSSPSCSGAGFITDGAFNDVRVRLIMSGTGQKRLIR
jgi:hypothetical protein